MAPTPQPTWSPPPPAPRWGPGRVIALVIGILVLLPALGLTVAGGLLLWADGPARNGDGYLYSSSDNFSSGGVALTSASGDPTTRGANWGPGSAAVGTPENQVTGNPRPPAFVGTPPG